MSNCINTNPVWQRPAHWKNLPGELGKTYNFLKKRDVSRDPLFVQLRSVMGRKRDFKRCRRTFMQAIFELILNRHDLVTGIIELNLEQMAEELSFSITEDDNGVKVKTKSKVPVCRVSRFIDDVMIRFGLAYVQCDGDKTGKTGMVWDRTNGIWFPKVLVLTDQFYRICGADVEKLNIQRDQLFIAKQQGLIFDGQVPSIRELRQLKKNMIFLKAWESRKEGARAGRMKSKLANKSLDDRRYDVAESLMKQDPEQMRDMSHEAFSKLTWQRMNTMGVDLFHQPDTKH